MEVYMFFLIFFSVYGMANWYITSHIFRMGLFSGNWKVPARLGWLLLVLAFPIGSICSHLCRLVVLDRLLWLGSWYLGLMTYSLLFFAAFDFWKLFSVLRRRMLGPGHRVRRNRNKKRTLDLFPLYALVMIVILVAGHINATQPQIRSFEVSLPGGKEKSTLRAALASDMHAGIMVNNHWLNKIVDTINETEPDIVFLVGDIVDSDVTQAHEEKLSEVLAELDAPLGAYAVTGNHEYYTDTVEAVKAIESGGVEVLLDEAREIGNLFVLVGRKDIQAERFEGSLKSLREILEGSNSDLPVIVLDHTPVRLEEAAETGVALQLSGHTHNGQLFPFNFITDAIFEQDWGFLKKGKTLFYTSCGVGTWGPPIRTNSRPEVVLLKIIFDPEAVFPEIL